MQYQLRLQALSDEQIFILNLGGEVKDLRLHNEDSSVAKAPSE